MRTLERGRKTGESIEKIRLIVSHSLSIKFLTIIFTVA